MANHNTVCRFIPETSKRLFCPTDASGILQWTLRQIHVVSFGDIDSSEMRRVSVDYVPTVSVLKNIGDLMLR